MRVRGAEIGGRSPGRSATMRCDPLSSSSSAAVRRAAASTSNEVTSICQTLRLGEYDLVDAGAPLLVGFASLIERSGRDTVAKGAADARSSLGSMMALSAGAVWSFGAITARLADHSDTFQYLAWRSIGIIAVIEGWHLVQRRPSQTVAAYTSGRRMLVANLALLVASIGFVYAVKTTSVANAAFLGATTPLFGVASARAFLGERLNWRTITAIAVAFMGLAIMLVGDLEAGGIVGDLAAISAAIGFALYTTIVRSAPDRDWSPVLPGYAIVMVAICVAVTLANGKTLVPPALDIGLAVVHGGLFVVAGNTAVQRRVAHRPRRHDDRVRPDRDGARAGVGVPRARRAPRPEHAGRRHDHPRCRRRQGLARRPSGDPARGGGAADRADTSRPPAESAARAT